MRPGIKLAGRDVMPYTICL